MEEMKAQADSSAPSGDAAEGEGGGKRFSLPALSKRTLILIGAGVLVLVLLVGGGLTYRARMQKAQAAAEVAAQQKREAAEREAAAREEMARLGEEARRSHQEIMAHSVKVADLSGTAAEAARPETEKAAKPEPEAAEMKPDVAEKPPAALPAGPKAEAERKPSGTSPAPAKAPVEAAVPDAAGGCTLSGKSAEDYGKALGRCLEEYNRLEGRPPRR